MPCFTSSGLDTVERQVFRVLSEIGVEFFHAKLLAALDGIGAQVEPGAHRVRFPAPLVERFLAACPKVDWAERTPTLHVGAAVYLGHYLDPVTDQFVPMDEGRLRQYAALARRLPEVGRCSMLGCSWAPRHELEPLYERFYCWQYGLDVGGSLYPTVAAPRLWDLYAAYATRRGRTVPEVFHGGVYLISPLRLGREEAAQFVWWWERGCRPWVGHMATGGLTAPVTVAGMVVLHLAEALALALLHWACYGEARFHVNAMAAAADMRSLLRPYGRPEAVAASRVLVALARRWGVGCFAQSGLTDAKRPSGEAGAQKAISATAALCDGADAMIAAGLLSVDEVFSPVQMVLDAELASALRHWLRPVDLSEAAIGFDAIAAAGPGGGFVDQEHTAQHFRQELWQPRLWSRTLLSQWQAQGAKLDVDVARARCLELLAEPLPPPLLAPDEERELRAIMETPGRP